MIQINRSKTRWRNWQHLVVFLMCLLGGCSTKVEVYKLGSISRAIDPNCEKMAKALELFEDGGHESATYLAETMIAEDTPNPQAVELVAVIKTLQGNGIRARYILDDAIEENPTESGLRKTYLWSLTKESRWDEAEEKALRAAKECVGDLELWDYHKVIRDKAVIRRRARRFLWKIVRLAGWAIGICSVFWFGCILGSQNRGQKDEV